MKYLVKQSSKNSPQEYDRIFKERSKIGVDSQDLRRWKLLLKYFVGGNLIDLGCLDSLVCPLALKKFPHSRLVGIDLASEAIKEMQKTYGPEITYKVGDVYHTKMKDNEFNYVVAGELIEHLERPEAFIQEAVRILKPSGVLALSTPNEEAIEPGAVDGHRHLWSFSVENIRDMLGKYGKVKIQILGSEFWPRYKYHFPSILAFLTKE